jgi:large subunit ribosomal protein L2
MFLYNKTYEFGIVKFKPVKNMYFFKKRISGRSSSGQIILTGRGGGIKKFYKIIDFFRFFRFIPAKVLRIEYDVNRLIFICLILYINGCLSYIICPSLLYVDDYIFSFSKNYLVIGSINYLYRIPLGTFVHNVELAICNKFKFARSAGCFVYILKKIGFFILVRLMSKEERFLKIYNSASIGKVSYELKKFLKYTKASSFKKFGKKSHVRGVAKNPIDHPHGGGEGRTTAGQPSVSPWGIYTKGIRTSTRFLRLNVLYRWGFFKRRNNKLW